MCRLTRRRRMKWCMAHVYTPLTPPNQVVPEISQATSDALAARWPKIPANGF